LQPALVTVPTQNSPRSSADILVFLAFHADGVGRGFRLLSQ
jgi:hypothetical protein